MDQITGGWYRAHTHRRHGVSDIWNDCRLISQTHPLFSREKQTHKVLTEADSGVNHVCLKRAADGELCLEEFRLLVKKRKQGAAGAAVRHWEEGT